MSELGKSLPLNPEYALLDRRSVLKLIGSACAISNLSGCLTGEIYTELGTTFAFDLSTPKFEALKTVGEAVDVDDAAGRPIILIRVNEDEIMAVSRICTHTQCDMKLGSPFGEWDGEKIICKCHNSHFAPDGSVLNPPANKPLASYPVQFDANNQSAKIVFAEEAETEAGTEAGTEATTNPFDGDQNAVEEGEQIYTANCVFCHGENGVGNTLPGADAFNIDQSAWTDAHLFDVLMNGIPNTAMAAYKDSLSEDEIWKVVTYIRSLRTDQ